MKGFVPTPASTVELMVEKLFSDRSVTSDANVLDPGCGPGAFIDGVIQWCQRRGPTLPRIVGVDSDPRHVTAAACRFADVPHVRIAKADFLTPSDKRFDYIIGNPPYVPITSLNAQERAAYRRTYRTAKGRFDLYLLFFEQALDLLKPGGRLVFVTPEKFIYVETAEPLRRLLGKFHVNEFHFLSESTFGDLVTYPLVSTITASQEPGQTRVVHRDGSITVLHLGNRTGSWLPAIHGVDSASSVLTLSDICLRISCGIATGADSVYLVRDADLDTRLRKFARPTIAGRQIGPGKPLTSLHSLLVPYSEDGCLLPERKLGELGRYLSEEARRTRLEGRTCVTRKPWYAFHETPPLKEVLRPKVLCKDIGETPFFIADNDGAILPRHSVYYIVPANPLCLDDLVTYLNSAPARRWLRDHCQRAANGFLRLQSHVLKRLPLPPSFAQFQQTVPGPQPEVEAQSA